MKKIGKTRLLAAISALLLLTGCKAGAGGDKAQELALAIRGEYLALEKRGATLEELETVTLGGLRRAVLEGDVDTGSVMCGQVAGMLHEIRPVKEILEELWTQGLIALQNQQGLYQYAPLEEK